ncbi:MAG: tautomerase family protein, partial [bacterium]
MPIVRMEESVARAPTERQALIECVYAALREVFGVSDEELQARYAQYAPSNLLPPGGKPDYLHIEITIFAGRTTDTKKRLYARLAADLSSLLGIAPTDIVILLNEQPGENWG